MNTASAFTRRLALRLSAAMLERVEAGVGEDGWVNVEFDRAFAAAVKAGLPQHAAARAACATLLGEQAREVLTTLMNHADRLEVRGTGAEAAAGA